MHSSLCVYLCVLFGLLQRNKVWSVRWCMLLGLLSFKIFRVFTCVRVRVRERGREEAVMRVYLCESVYSYLIFS